MGRGALPPRAPSPASQERGENRQSRSSCPAGGEVGSPRRRTWCRRCRGFNRLTSGGCPTAEDFDSHRSLRGRPRRRPLRRCCRFFRPPPQVTDEIHEVIAGAEVARAYDRLAARGGAALQLAHLHSLTSSTVASCPLPSPRSATRNHPHTHRPTTSPSTWRGCALPTPWSSSSRRWSRRRSRGR